MKRHSFLLIAAALALAVACNDNKKPVENTEANAETPDVLTPKDLGWKMGCQAYTFKEFTYADALEKIDSLGLSNVEMYSGQPIGNGIEGTTHYGMDDYTIQQVKQMTGDFGIDIVAYGVVKPKDEEEWRQIFEFAHKLHIENITCEPQREHLDFLEKMAEEYAINIAIHNHPKESPYWHPDSVLSAVDGRSERMGACADVGHWTRSGLDPIECLQALEGRVISLHIKDVDAAERQGKDQVWGTGLTNIKAVVKEMYRQDFEGPWSVEYENNWKNNVPDIKASLEYFNEKVANLE
jgi:sugar phosphate isomerase/epimerase